MNLRDFVGRMHLASNVIRDRQERTLGDQFSLRVVQEPEVYVAIPQGDNTFDVRKIVRVSAEGPRVRIETE